MDKATLMKEESEHQILLVMPDGNAYEIIPLPPHRFNLSFTDRDICYYDPAIPITERTFKEALHAIADEIFSMIVKEK